MFISHLLFCFSSLYAGSADITVDGKQRSFIGYSHCREALGLIKGKTYLIMGTLEDTEKKADEYVSCFHISKH